ncbi:MAG: tRNA-dihydrouridine synthase family protein [Phycisphaerae bacterium]|nr:tRNA-dihydrouridine synthase family protein [Phycisphaerae bacterium]
MSVPVTTSEEPARELPRPVAEIAAGTSIDPRIAALVPGFDAPFFQAGLAGYSDGAMRLLARRHGAPFCVTEALLDRTLINGGKGRRKEDPDLIATECGMGEIEDNRAATLDDHPIAGQIMGTDPGEMADGSRILLSMGYEVIDVNLACPVKKIRRSNRGGHFLAVPDEAIRVLESVRRATPASVPCTVKLRRSYDDTPEMVRAFERIFDAAYDLGYAWTTVHCRTVVQRYEGPGRWEFLSALTAKHPERLVFGSGDVWSVDDIFAMLEICRVQAVSVARGCIGNPWIFRQARELMAGRPALPPSIEEQGCVLRAHFDLARVIHGERSAGQRMRKFGIRFARHHPGESEVKAAFIRCETPAQWFEVIDHWYGVSEAKAPSVPLAVSATSARRKTSPSSSRSPQASTERTSSTRSPIAASDPAAA